MKNIFKALTIICLMVLSSGCVIRDEIVTPDINATYANPQYGCITVEDEDGFRDVCAYYFYQDEELFYYDVNFGVWVGRGGWWSSGHYYRGWYHGYRGYYHNYHSYHGYHEFHSGGHRR